MVKSEITLLQRRCRVKPFDLQDLVSRLKANGVAEADALAKIAANSVIAWLEDSLNAEPSPLFKIGVPVLEALKPLILAEIDKALPVPPAAS